MLLDWPSPGYYKAGWGSIRIMGSFDVKTLLSGKGEPIQFCASVAAGVGRR